MPLSNAGAAEPPSPDGEPRSGPGPQQRPDPGAPLTDLPDPDSLLLDSENHETSSPATEELETAEPPKVGIDRLADEIKDLLAVSALPVEGHGHLDHFDKAAAEAAKIVGSPNLVAGTVRWIVTAGFMATGAPAPFPQFAGYCAFRTAEHLADDHVTDVDTLRAKAVVAFTEALHVADVLSCASRRALESCESLRLLQRRYGEARLDAILDDFIPAAAHDVASPFQPRTDGSGDATPSTGGDVEGPACEAGGSGMPEQPWSPFQRQVTHESETLGTVAPQDGRSRTFEAPDLGAEAAAEPRPEAVPNPWFSSVKPAEEPGFLFFWDHRRTHDGKLAPGCLDQWWPSPIRIGGRRFATAEHYMMWSKARLFEDGETAAAILADDDPERAQELGRAVAGFDRKVWERHRFPIVVRGSMAKFGQRGELRNFLLSTGDRVLVEASPDDALWGIGLEADDPRAADPRTWQGQNLLGFALMVARQQLRAKG
jgi:ribA/ribD-fused uncharacterized protein